MLPGCGKIDVTLGYKGSLKAACVIRVWLVR